MATFCIPKHLISKLKDSAIKGEVDIKKLYEMTSKERNEYFAKFTDKEVGKFINLKFEQAAVSKRKGAILDWAKSVFDPKEQVKPEYQNVIKKINSLSESGALGKEGDIILEDLVASKLGININPDEVRVIETKAKVIQEQQKSLGDNLGNIVEDYEGNMKFLKAKAEMDKYLESLNPSSKLKLLTGTIGRGMMLASFKSPILNIASNSELALTEALARRFSKNPFAYTDSKLALDWIKKASKIYKETGYDLSRMQNIHDLGTSGQRVLGDIPTTQGKGVTRKVARVVEDVVFKKLMGGPDAFFGRLHFADSLNTNAIKMADGNKVEARKLMIEAMKIGTDMSPKAEILRQQAIQDALYATFTNETWASRTSEGLRRVLNSATGDARVGDFVMPFVKTPANVISTGLDYAGVGIPKAMIEVVSAIRRKELTPQAAKRLSTDLFRAGTGIVGAIAITNQIDNSDFVGAYDPARKQIETLRNSNTNAIKIGNRWISLDWFGPLSVPISSIMYARKYGDTRGEKAVQYALGASKQLSNIPGIKQLADFYDQVQDTKQTATTTGELVSGVSQYALEQTYSRLVPSLLSDIAKAKDPYQRQPAEGPTGKLIPKIPVLRENLPIKTDVLGRPMKEEPWWSVLSFGARVKTTTENSLIKELDDMSRIVGKNINFTDFEKSTSKQVAQFKETLTPEEFKTAKVEYGKLLEAELNKILDSRKYQQATDEKGYNMIIAADTEAMDKLFKKYKFKYKPAKKK